MSLSRRDFMKAASSRRLLPGWWAVVAMLVNLLRLPLSTEWRVEILLKHK